MTLLGISSLRGSDIVCAIASPPHRPTVSCAWPAEAALLGSNSRAWTELALQAGRAQCAAQPFRPTRARVSLMGARALTVMVFSQSSGLPKGGWMCGCAGQGSGGDTVRWDGMVPGWHKVDLKRVECWGEASQVAS